MEVKYEKNNVDLATVGDVIMYDGAPCLVGGPIAGVSLTMRLTDLKTGHVPRFFHDRDEFKREARHNNWKAVDAMVIIKQD